MTSGLVKSSCLQTRMPVLADDDQIMDRDAEWFRDVDDRACHLDIRLL